MNVSPRQTDLVKHIVGMLKEWVISDVMGEGGPGTYGALMNSLRKMHGGREMTMEDIACSVIDFSVIKPLGPTHQFSIRFNKSSRMADDDPNIELLMILDCSSSMLTWTERTITVHLENTNGPSTQSVLQYIRTHGRSRKRVDLSERASSMLKEQLIEGMDEMKDILRL